MAKNNPWLAVEKLRQESGADEIIVGSYTQSEPAISYKLGSSIMSVDMTVADWPNPGIGTVTTSRADADNAVQYFQPKGSTSTWTRSWNDSLPDLNDDFSNPTLDSQKWQELTGSGTGAISTGPGVGNVLSFQAGYTWYSSVQSLFAFTGDYDVQIYVPSAQSGGYVYGSMMNVSQAGILTHSASTTNKEEMRIFTTDGKVQVIGYSTSNMNVGTATFPCWIRHTRIGTTGTMQLKVGGGDWVTKFSGSIDTDDRLYHMQVSYGGVQGARTANLDDFTINSGTPYLLSGGTSIWQPWTEVKSAEDQLVIAQNEATTAVTNHETSYDHSTFSSLTRNRIIYVDDAGGNTEIDTSTTFSNIADVDLFINGLRMLAGNEFTDSATNPGTYITLTAPTVAGDDIEIIVWKV